MKVEMEPSEWLKPPEPPERITFDKMNETWGSSAGAGSDFFHLYRKRRDHEMERLAKMDADWDKRNDNISFQQKRAEWMQASDDATAKKRAKRQKKKDVAAQKKSAEHCTVNRFSNDGNFLEKA